MSLYIRPQLESSHLEARAGLLFKEVYLEIETVPEPSLDPTLPRKVIWAFSLICRYPGKGPLAIFIQRKLGVREKL